jgi:MFS family permease
MSPTLAIARKQPARAGWALLLTSVAFFMVTLDSLVVAALPAIHRELLTAARAMQGLGAAIVTPLSLTILTTAFGPERRGRVIGIWGSIAGLAVAAGGRPANSARPHRVRSRRASWPPTPTVTRSG